MVYECSSGHTCWSDDADREFPSGGGSQIIVCPDCGGRLSKVCGPVEKDVARVLDADGNEAKSMDTLASETGHDKKIVKRALRHMIDMGLIGTTPGWDYRLGTRGREKLT